MSDVYWTIPVDKIDILKHSETKWRTRSTDKISEVISHFASVHSILVKSHCFAVSLTVLAMTSRSHADYVISPAFQLLQNLRNKYYGFMNKPIKPLVWVLVVSDLILAT